VKSPIWTGEKAKERLSFHSRWIDKAQVLACTFELLAVSIDEA
jgi:hypothetical protein